MRKYVERHPVATLGDAFLSANRLEYGPFAVEKLQAQDWGEGGFTINDTHVSLQPRKVQIMAVLIAQQGEIATPAMLAQAMDVRNMDASRIAANDPLLKNNHVHLSQLRTVFDKQTGTDAYSSMIQPAQTRLESVAKATRNPDIVGCYKLVIPDPTG